MGAAGVDRYAIAAAIVASACALGVILHQGLARIADAMEHSAQSAPPAVGPPQPSAEPAAVPASIAEPVRPDPALLARDQEIRVAERALDALTQQQSDYTRACWKPPAAQAPNFVRFEVELSFDATGLETRRTIREGSPGFPGLLECVKRQHLAALHIPGNGSAVSTSVSLTLP